MPNIRFGGVNPIFRVSNLAASLDHYVRVFGFKIDWRHPYNASVSRDRCGIFLAEGDQGHCGGWVWIGVGESAEVDALAEEIRSAGGKIRHPPTNYSWAYEMQVEDLDGNVLRIGGEPKAGEPQGEWLDMHGRVWPPDPAATES